MEDNVWQNVSYNLLSVIKTYLIVHLSLWFTLITCVSPSYFPVFTNSKVAEK